MHEQSKRREDALIQVWNRLEGMWEHSHDGSFFSPAKFLPNKIAKHISPLRKKDLK